MNCERIGEPQLPSSISIRIATPVTGRHRRHPEDRVLRIGVLPRCPSGLRLEVRDSPFRATMVTAPEIWPE
jgi:hypothetical protein